MLEEVIGMLLDIFFVGSAALVSNGIALLIVLYQNRQVLQPIPIEERSTAKWDKSFVNGLDK